MDLRNRYRIRQLCDLTVAMLEIGIFDTRGAADHMRKFGVPLEAALRLLGRKA